MSLSKIMARGKFPEPKLPDGYSATWEGPSGSYPGTYYYTLYLPNGCRIGLFYSDNRFWACDDRTGPTNEEERKITQFPSRKAMYNWIETKCLLDAWEGV